MNCTNGICDAANPKAIDKVNVWQEDFLIRFGAIDRSDRMTLDAVFEFFQEAAICHAENLGVGREDMAQTGQAWVLSRMSVVVDRRPKYTETVTVRSWPCSYEKLFAIRNYQIVDKDGKAVVSARSGWLIVDIEKRRPLRPQIVMDNMPKNEGLDALPPEANGAAGLAERDNLKEVACRKPCYTDLDYNKHVNNVRYIQWIEDTLELQLLEKADKMRLDINYMNEIVEGETIEILCAPIEDVSVTHAFAFEGRDKESKKTAFRAELRLW
ncbi:MAG: thioesterase [Treponema sp.]|nr:thioesterase [Treponema sp.]MCL2251029.1 thioesterase [Treponema sp.]